MPLRPWVLHYLAKRSRVRIDKARELLGYRPLFGLEDGMRLTEQVGALGWTRVVIPRLLERRRWTAPRDQVPSPRP